MAEGGIDDEMDPDEVERFVTFLLFPVSHVNLRLLTEFVKRNALSHLRTRTPHSLLVDSTMSRCEERMGTWKDCTMTRTATPINIYP